MKKYSELQKTNLKAHLMLKGHALLVWVMWFMLIWYLALPVRFVVMMIFIMSATIMFWYYDTKSSSLQPNSAKESDIGNLEIGGLYSFKLDELYIIKVMQVVNGLVSYVKINNLTKMPEGSCGAFNKGVSSSSVYTRGINSFNESFEHIQTRLAKTTLDETIINNCEL